MIDHNNHPVLLFITIISAIIGITLRDVQIILSITASITAIITGIFTIRYYYKQTKKL